MARIENIPSPTWMPTPSSVRISLLSIEPGNGEIEKIAQLMEGRPCRIGQPDGPVGTVVRVYRHLYRYGAIAMCKVDMVSGTARYVDALEIFCFCA